MKTLKIKIIALMMIVAVALTGCINYDVTVKITKDDKVTTTIVLNIDREEYIEYASSMSAGTEMTQSEEALDKDMISQGFTIVTIDNKEYYTKTQKNTYTTKEYLNNVCSDGGEAYVTTDTFYVKTSDVTDMATGSDSASGSMMSEEDAAELKSLMTMTISLEFAAPVVSSNSNVTSDSPNVAVFDILSLADEYVFATTKSGVTVKSVKKTVKALNKVKAPKIKKLKANKVKAKAKKATVTLKFSKVKGVKKYQIQYSTKKKFSTYTEKTTKKNKIIIKKLKKGKKYYVRVRACKKNYAGIEVYSKWTKSKVKTKK